MTPGFFATYKESHLMSPLASRIVALLHSNDPRGRKAVDLLMRRIGSGDPSAQATLDEILSAMIDTSGGLLDIPGVTLATSNDLNAIRDSLRAHAASVNASMQSKASSSLLASWTAWYPIWSRKLDAMDLDGWFGHGPKLALLQADVRELDLWNAKLGWSSNTPDLGNAKPGGDPDAGLLATLGGYKTLLVAGGVIVLVMLAPAFSALASAFAMRTAMKAKIEGPAKPSSLVAPRALALAEENP